ncbi:hypothetical protein BpHYR1_033043 [Brachionus plicatilis]|uniref:Uncharacterized protein n=1 Tax=Brachionus plicatilis TaxID=10195 RepID=A0A3M7S198_BRAPC|nr:hypothetical protein BpHYR1_033043 [Brachionus plicatilis]
MSDCVASQLNIKANKHDFGSQKWNFQTKNMIPKAALKLDIQHTNSFKIENRWHCHNGKVIQKTSDYQEFLQVTSLKSTQRPDLEFNFSDYGLN